MLSLNRRPRYVYSLCTLAVAFWIAWVAVGVQQLVLNHKNAVPSSSNASIVVQEQPDLVDWHLYGCWADYIESLGLRTNGRFVSVLRPIRLTGHVDQRLVRSTVDAALSSRPVVIENDQSSNLELQIGRSIANLQAQLTLVLVVTGSMFLIVVVFIVYVCFVGGRRRRTTTGCSRQPAAVRVPATLVRAGEPVGQITPVVLESPAGNGRWKMLLDSLDDQHVVSMSSRHALLWDGATGRPLRNLLHQSRPAGRLWCAASWSDGFLAAGTSDGTVLLTHIFATSQWTVVSDGSAGGAVDMAAAGDRLVVGRADGQLDFFQIAAPSGSEVRCWLVARRPTATAINCLQIADGRALSAGDDGAVNVFSLANGTMLYALAGGHRAPILSLVAGDSLAFSCSLGGQLSCWNLTTASLSWTANDLVGTDSLLSLRLAGTVLLGYCSARLLWLWSASTGQLMTCIRPQQPTGPCDFGGLYDMPQMALLGDGLLATACSGGVQFWDLDRKVMLRQVVIDQCRRLRPPLCLRRLGPRSVVCLVDGAVLRVQLPIIKA